MEPHESEEIASLTIDKNLAYLYDSERANDPTWIFLEQAQKKDFDHKEKCNHKYKFKLPDPKEFCAFSSNIYNNYDANVSKNIDVDKQWRLLYRVQGKVIYELFDGFFAELYFNTENHYLLLVIKGPTVTSVGNFWSDIKNVGLGFKGGELDSAFTFGEKVRVLMNEFKCKPMLLITGHSLGGYLAQIITYTINYCFVDECGRVLSRKEPMDDFGIYTVVFDSPAALKQISSIDPKDPIQPERFRLPIVNFIVDVNIINSNSKVGPHLGQVISVKEFGDLNAPNKWRRIIKVLPIHGIKNFEDVDLTQCRQVEYLPHSKTVKYEEKEIHSCFFSSKNFERLHKYVILASMCAEFVERLPKFKIFKSHIFLQDKKVPLEEFILLAHRFLYQFKDDLDISVFNGKNVIDNALYNLWRAEMLKDAHEFFLTKEWIQKVENWEDGTKIGGFESYEEMRFVGCMLHNSIPSCFHFDYEQFIDLDRKVVDNFKATNRLTLILIVKNKNQQIYQWAGKRVKVVYLVLDSIADEKTTMNPSTLDEKSQELLKNTQLQFMGNEVSVLDIFGNELMEKLTIWEIYNFYKDVVQYPNHFYSDQKISGESVSFESAIAFARELMKREMQFVLISSDTGIGKSTALRQIALTLQRELPNNWIVYVNLFDIQNDLSSSKDTLTSKKAAVEFIRDLELADRKSDEVLTKVFTWKLQEKKIVFLFDSLDEVCPLHRETVEKFITLLRETQLLIVLTTRPHEGKNFQNADIFKLKPLNDKQIRNFIVKKFEMLGKDPPADPHQLLDNICDKDDFWSLPLNLNMATSIYNADFQEQSGLKEKKNIYEEFLTKSIENTLKYKFDLEKNKHRAASMQIYKNIVEKFNRFFENLAFCLIFYGGEINCLESKKLKENIKQYREDINRFDIAKLDNKCKFVSFLHRSYAEYLVAQVFLKYHQNDQFQIFQLNNEHLKSIYFKDELIQVRQHICGILAASPSAKMDFVPFVIGVNKRKLLEVLIYEDCYELYMQIKKYVKFIFKYSIFGFTYYNDLNPLYLALKNSRREFVQQLIDDGAKFEDILNQKGVLHLAIEKGLHQKVVDHFESLRLNIDINHKCLDSQLILHYAAQYAKKELTEFLIKNDASVDATSNPHSDKTALFFAIKANNVEVVKVLIANRADCSKALKWVAQYNRTELVDVIYKKIPAVGRVKRVKNALFNAVIYGNLDVFKRLSEISEANPLAVNSDGDTFLQCAARKGHLHCMPFIFDYMKQSVDIANSGGQTALMRALSFNQEEVVQWLLEQHADIHAVDEKGRSCLHFAAEGGNSDLLELCLYAGADVNSLDNRGRSAIFYALQEHTVSYLLEKGADPTITDKDGNTCLHFGLDTASPLSLESVKLC